MTVFVAVSQISPERVTYALRSTGDPLRNGGSVQQIVREADSRIAVTNVMTQAAEIDIHMALGAERGAVVWMVLRRVLALAGAVLLGAVILAGYGPARRASRIDPLAALRME